MTIRRTLPVSIGRAVIGWLAAGGANTSATSAASVHELYTVSTGLYVCYVLTFGTVQASVWLAQEWPAIRGAVQHGTKVAFKCVLACIGTVIIMPLLLGVAFQLMLLTPLRVLPNQSPLYFPIQDWAMGVLHFKILCACVMMGPDWWLKRVFEQLYENGIVNLNVVYLYTHLVIPLSSAVGLFIALPYIAIFGVAPYFGVGEESAIVIQRSIYLCLVFFALLVTFLVWQVRLIGKLIMRIRDDKYLMGQRLVNYERLEIRT